LVAKAVVVKAAISLVDVTGLPDGLVQRAAQETIGFLSLLSAPSRASPVMLGCDLLP
jgi:hypothetical protein